MTVADGFFFHYPELQFFWAWNLNHLSHPLMPFDAHSSMIFTKKILSFVQFFYIKNRLVIPCEKKIGDSFFFFRNWKKNPTAIFYLFEQKLIKTWIPLFWDELVRKPQIQTSHIEKNYRLIIFKKHFFFKSSRTHHLFDTYFNKIQNM